MNTKNTFFVIINFITVMCLAQQQETITVPLSSPGQPGKLEIMIHNGSIKVEGYNGQEVEIEISGDTDKDIQRDNSRGTLKRIPNNAIDVDITEYENTVEIHGTNRRTDFRVKVPKNFSMVLGSHHNSDIHVKGVNGEMEVQSHHGSIELHDIGGTVIAGTHHGTILATLNSVMNDKPMAFSTYHGDIEVSFPANFSGTTKIKTVRGEVFTDFEMDLKSSNPEKNKTQHGKHEIKLAGWIVGEIGNGGEEHMFTTHHGDVIIRKNQ